MTRWTPSMERFKEWTFRFLPCVLPLSNLLLLLVHLLDHLSHLDAELRVGRQDLRLTLLQLIHFLFEHLELENQQRQSTSVFWLNQHNRDIWQMIWWRTSTWSCKRCLSSWSFTNSFWSSPFKFGFIWLDCLTYGQASLLGGLIIHFSVDLLITMHTNELSSASSNRVCSSFARVPIRCSSSCRWLTFCRCAFKIPKQRFISTRSSRKASSWGNWESDRVAKAILFKQRKKIIWERIAWGKT